MAQTQKPQETSTELLDQGVDPWGRPWREYRQIDGEIDG